MYIFEPVDINSGNIYFGGIPQNSLLQYSGKCKINSENWGCYLDNIYFTNDSNKHLYLYKTNISNNYAEFDVGRKCIFARKEYFYFVKNTFFEKHFPLIKLQIFLLSEVVHKNHSCLRLSALNILCQGVCGTNHDRSEVAFLFPALLQQEIEP